MLDKIPIIGDSWIGTLLSYVILVFFYYFIWMIIAMILLNTTTKRAFMYGKRSNAKAVVRGMIILFLIGGFNLSMYALGLYSLNIDGIFLFLLSILSSVMIISMIDIMSEKLSGAEEFYNTMIAFILTIGFLSPTKGLLTLNFVDKLYLLGGMFFTFLLFSFKFVSNWAGSITMRFTNYLMKNLKLK